MLRCKIRYLLTTCPQSLSHASPVLGGGTQEPSFRCKFCGSVTQGSCQTCLQSLIHESRTMHLELAKDSAFIETIPQLDRDPRVDLSLVAASALLRLAGIGRGTEVSRTSPIAKAEAPRVLQAALVLDSQLAKTPGDISLRLLLVRLYLLLGCSTLAYQLWRTLDVKRTIQDALSPLFFDRISRFSPGLFQTHSGKPLMEPLRSYYRAVLRDSGPVKNWDAFLAGSYSSILDMAEFNDRLRRSCTRVMTVVEERQATRAFGGKLEDLEDIELFCKSTQSGRFGMLTLISSTAEATNEICFVNVTDYGPLPDLESSHSPSLPQLIQVGPCLSVRIKSESQHRLKAR